MDFFKKIIKEIKDNAKDREIIIWGACKSGQILEKEFLNQGIKIAGFVDKKAEIFELIGKNIISPKDLINKNDKIYIVVAVVNYYKEIEDFLNNNMYNDKIDYWYIYKSNKIKNIKNYSDNKGNKIEGSLQNTVVEFGGYNNKLIIGDDVDTYNANIEVRFLSNNSCLHIGNQCCFDGKIHIYIHENSKIVINEKCTFRDATYFSCAIDSEITIGKNSTFNDMLLLFSTFSGILEIGDDCMASLSVTIGNNDGHAIFDVQTGKNINGGEKIYIGNHVWLGNKCTVLSGSKIGDGSIVAANSVLAGKKNIPNNCIVGGNPAVVIKKNIAWDRSITDYDLLKGSSTCKLTKS